MKHNIKYSFYILLATFLFTFLLIMSSPLLSQPQSLVYSTSQQEQEADQQEDLQTSSDTPESETNTGSINSAQREDSNGDENNNDDSIESEVGCSAVATNDPNYVYCNTPQPKQPQQQTSEQPPQQNTPSNPSQNTLTGPTIDSDTSLSNIPNTETTTTTTQKSFNPAGQFKPGSGQTESNIPLLLNNFSKPFAPGAGNAQVEGIGLAYLTVYPNFTYTGPVEICVFTSHQYEVKANPYCVEPYPDGTFHALQAPGLVGIRVSGNTDPVDTSNCEFRIYPKQSESCILRSLDSPFIKLKSETTEQDTTLSFNR